MEKREAMRFVEFRQEVGQVVAVFQYQYYDYDMGFIMAFDKKTLQLRLQNLKANGFAYEETERALNLWPTEETEQS